MALNIKNNDVETLLDKLIASTGESKTEAVRVALNERLQRLAIETASPPKTRLAAFLETELWAQIPQNLYGTTITKAEEEEILGYGADGV